MELGLVPGTRVSVTRVAPLGDPLELRLRNYALSIRRAEALSIEVDEPYRRGLEGLERASHLVILSWFDRAERNLITQRPRHAPRPSGTFALRSPVRPNPIGLHVARLLGVDPATGVLEIDAIDVLDGTPVLDLKPYHSSIDAFADAVVKPAES